MTPSTEARIDRLELLLRSMRDDLAVSGVLWSRETDALFVEMPRARVIGDLGKRVAGGVAVGT